MFKKDAQATLYRKDPRMSKDGILETRITGEDAYIDIELIHLTEMYEEQEFCVQALESKTIHGKPVLPICPDETNFSYMEAYGFFFKVIDIAITDQLKRKFEIYALYNPEGLLDDAPPLTANYIGNHSFKLDRPYSKFMNSPAGLRSFTNGSHHRIISLTRSSSDPNILTFKTRSLPIEFRQGEQIKILTNWHTTLPSI